uniref:Endonuclease/exonuclease/phosphatase domain-containing protein n=1 Tax=Ursus americanus TaxID=9643 RepID=A0A452R9F6_URSAM
MNFLISYLISWLTHSFFSRMGAANYISQLLIRIKRHIDNNILIVGDINTPLLTIDRSSKQKISKETRGLNDILDQMDLIDIYRTLHPRTTEYSFFSNSHGTFSRINHILGHKTGLNQYRKTEIIPCIFSDHSALKLEFKQKKKKFGRNSNTWKLRTILLKNDWVGAPGWHSG